MYLDMCAHVKNERVPVHVCVYVHVRVYACVRVYYARGKMYRDNTHSHTHT